MSEGTTDASPEQPSPSSPTFTLKIQLPVATVQPLMEEIEAIAGRSESGSLSRQFLDSVVRSLRAAQVVTQPDQVSLRDRLRFAAEYARSSAERTEKAGHPATPTLLRIADTLDDVLGGDDEEITRRMPEVENLIRRLNEFSVG